MIGPKNCWKQILYHSLESDYSINEQGCATSITLGASSSQHSGTRKASGAKLSCEIFLGTLHVYIYIYIHTYIYMSNTQIKKNINKCTKTTAVREHTVL